MALLQARIYKNIVGAAREREWCNTHNFYTPDELTSEAVDDFVDALVIFEKKMHLPDVQFNRCVVSTAYKEGRKGHPEAFKTFPLSGTGGNNLASMDPGVDHLPTEHVLVVEYGAATGRPGKNLFRRCIAGNMWTDVGGTPQLGHATLDQWIATIENSLDPAQKSMLRIVPSGANPAELGREVLSVKVTGLATRQLRQPRRKKAAAADEEGWISQVDDLAIEVGKAVATAIVLKGAGKLLASPAVTSAIGRLGASVGSMLPALGPAL